MYARRAKIIREDIVIIEHSCVLEFFGIKFAPSNKVASFHLLSVQVINDIVKAHHTIEIKRL